MIFYFCFIKFGKVINIVKSKLPRVSAFREKNQEINELINIVSFVKGNFVLEISKINMVTLLGLRFLIFQYNIKSTLDNILKFSFLLNFIYHVKRDLLIYKYRNEN